MVDITNFAEMAAPEPWPLALAAGSARLLPHAAFGLCFAFTMALVLGIV